MEKKEGTPTRILQFHDHLFCLGTNSFHLGPGQVANDTKQAELAMGAHMQHIHEGLVRQRLGSIIINIRIQNLQWLLKRKNT